MAPDARKLLFCTTTTAKKYNAKNIEAIFTIYRLKYTLAKVIFCSSASKQI